MVTLKFSQILALTSCLMLASSIARAGEGGMDGGGGDLCQERIESIRNDIEKWIVGSNRSTPTNKYGSAQLDFSQSGTSLDAYNIKMLEVIQATRKDSQRSISCTDDKSKVRFEGAEKLCVSYWEGPSPHMLCYRGTTSGNGVYANGIMGASDDEQYFQIHHELAVLAGLEDQKDRSTNYPLSKQISGMLETRQVRMLAIQKGGREAAPHLSEIVRNADGSVRNFSQFEASRYCHDQGTRLPTARELAIYARDLGADFSDSIASYERIDGLNPDGSQDLFYFNAQNVIENIWGKMGRYIFWSSTVQPVSSCPAYALNVGQGRLLTYGRWETNVFFAVRCVRSE
jgi:hypothetical protein